MSTRTPGALLKRDALKRQGEKGIGRGGGAGRECEGESKQERKRRKSSRQKNQGVDVDTYGERREGKEITR